MRLPFREELTNDGTYYHGGVVVDGIDTAGAARGMEQPRLHQGHPASTVSMTVQYVGAAKRSDLLCTARTVKRGQGADVHRDHRHGRGRRGSSPTAVQTYRIV